MPSLFRRKSVDLIMRDAEAGDEARLKRSLGPVDLISLGIGR